MYLNTEKSIEIIDKHTSSSNSVIDNLYSAYIGLEKEGIVENREVKLLETWLKSF